MSGWRAGLVAMVVGGLVLLTGWLLSRSPVTADEPVPGEAAGPATTPEPTDGDVVLVCPEVLEPACRSVGAELGVAVDGWEPGDQPPARGVVLAAAAELPETGTDPVEVAGSPVVVAGWLSRWQPLELDCGGTVDVACLAGRLATPWEDLGAPSGWGSVTVGLVDPTRSEAGMAAWAMLAPHVEDSSLGEALRITAGDDADLMAEFVRVGDSRANFVVTTESAVLGQFENAIGRGGRLALAYPAEGPWVTYSAVASGRGGDDLLERLGSPEAGAALTSSGVRPVGGPVGTPPEGMGEPGEPVPLPDETTRGTLVDEWDTLT